MGRRYRGSISVDVDIDDIIGELSDKDIRGAFEDRFGAMAANHDFDLLEEVRAELVGGRTNAAFALVESALVAKRISDVAKLDAYAAAARAH